MSNPFKTNNKSNRFSALEEDNNTNTNKFKQSKLKDVSSLVSNNSFKTRAKENKIYNKEPKQKKEILVEPTNTNTNTNTDFIDNTELFPELNVSTNTKVSDDETFKYNFKNILTNVVQDDAETKKVISPGWTEITYNKQKIHFEHGEQTSLMIKIHNAEKYKTNINYMMNETILQMKQKWDEYEDNYDDLYGEGAYDQTFRLPPIFNEDEILDNDIETNSDISEEEDINCV